VAESFCSPIWPISGSTCGDCGKVAKILGDHGQRFGVEYLGPKTSWTAGRHTFIHTMAMTKAFALVDQQPVYRSRPCSGWHGRLSIDRGREDESQDASYCRVEPSPGPGRIVDGMVVYEPGAQGSQELHGSHGTAHGSQTVICGVEEGNSAPRRNQLHCWQPIELAVSITTAVRTNSFFIIEISCRNRPVRPTG